jgi:hypothetical protein
MSTPALSRTHRARPGLPEGPPLDSGTLSTQSGVGGGREVVSKIVEV